MQIPTLFWLAIVCIGLSASGCAYDPSIGVYVPCCAVAPRYAYATPPAPAVQTSAEPTGAGPMEAEPAAPPPHTDTGALGLAARFQRANATGDGRLTLQQAQAAGWKRIVHNFTAIDAERKGFVTLADIQAWRTTRHLSAAVAPPPA